MAKKFSATESQITNQFKKGTTFSFNDKNYTVLKAGKPSPPKGECKTDTYILAQDEKENEIEIKISIKQKNADFLENKISLERAKQIFGSEASSVIMNSLKQIEVSFKNDYLITFDNYKKTEEKTLKIGWKFELMNKLSGDKSGEIILTPKQLLDVYAGTQLDTNKKNSKVNNEETKDSGIANYIFIANIGKEYTAQEIINGMETIEDYTIDKKIFFACKAINYRVKKDKWDGNRPLAVYIKWGLKNKKLEGKIILNKPLEVKANIVGINIRTLLKKLNIEEKNFDELENKLKNVKFYRKE